MYMCCIYITHTYMYILPNMPPFFKIYDETNINPLILFSILVHH